MPVRTMPALGTRCHMVVVDKDGVGDIGPGHPSGLRERRSHRADKGQGD